MLKALLDRTPIVRFDFDRDARRKPSSHIQIHAHRGAMSHVLSQAGHREPHALESLHFPTGGARFRPCLEDVIEFLATDCGFDTRQGWIDVVADRREWWRRLQTRAVVRDAPSEAVRCLEKLGYTIAPPSSGVPADSMKPLRTW